MIRVARPNDAPVLAAIYGWHVQNGVGTFEETPPDAAVMVQRLANIRSHDLPFVLVEAAGEVVAFAYAAPFRLRGGYRFTAEDSVYVRHDRIGRGHGRAALTAVIEGCRARGLSQLAGLIGDADNTASISLHRALGFAHIAVLPRLGFKAGRFLDVVWMQLDLGPPSGQGLRLET